MSNPSAPPSLLTELVASAVRHGLTAVSTLLVADGLVTKDQGQQVVTLGLGVAQPIADLVLQQFDAGKADVVTLIYSRFRSVVQEYPLQQQAAPAQPGAQAPAAAPAKAAPAPAKAAPVPAPAPVKK